MTEKNPLIEPENYFDGYNQSAKNAAMAEPGQVAFDELCFTVLGLTEDGKKLMEILKERFIMPSVPAKLGLDFPISATYYEGFREAFRQLIGHVEGYKARKLYEAKKAEECVN